MAAPFVDDVAKAWHGAGILEKMAATEPFRFAELAGRLVPRDVANTLAPAKLPTRRIGRRWWASSRRSRRGSAEVLRSPRRRMSAGMWAARWMRSKKSVRAARRLPIGLGGWRLQKPRVGRRLHCRPWLALG
jgi:hypothetical protein